MVLRAVKEELLEMATSDFKAFVDPGFMCEFYQKHYPGIEGTSWKITNCSIVNSKFKGYFKPESKRKATLSICHELTLKDVRKEIYKNQILYAKVFLDGRSVQEFARQVHYQWVRPEYGQALTHFPDQDMIVWAFPNDPGLPQLTILMNDAKVFPHFPITAWSLTDSGITDSFTVRAQVVNYRPEIRCTIKYELRGPGVHNPVVLFGKTFRHENGKKLFQRMKLFWDRHQVQPGSLIVAEPLSYSQTLNTMWQRGIQGVPLLTILDKGNFHIFAEQIAQGLASLHKSQVPDLGVSTIDHHVLEVQKKARKLGQGCPNLATKLQLLVKDLAETAPSQKEIISCPIYWDFHINQLLASGDRIVFFDFDEMIGGDPIQDVANFIVDLNFRPLPVGFVRQLSASFLSAYQKNVDWAVPLVRLKWHARIQFLNKAYRHYIQQCPDWARTLETVLGMIEKDDPSGAVHAGPESV